ncbi:MAG TPA: isochorismatase family protein [bacterium]|nr:isochorismatase family protein [bacterium]
MLDKKRSLLLVTDVQGKLAQIMFEKEALFKNIGIIIDSFKILDIPILWLEQYPKLLGPTVKEVSSHLEGYKSMPKKTFSAMKDRNILNRFNELGRDQILMIGIETHICIYQTSIDLLSMGIETHVVRDAVSSRTESNKITGLEKIARAGGHITSVETALFELLGIAEGEVFKKILELVK